MDNGTTTAMAVRESQWAALSVTTWVRRIAADRPKLVHVSGAFFNTERTESRVYTTPDEQ